MGEDWRAKELIEAVEAASGNGDLWPRVFELLADYGAPLAEMGTAKMGTATPARRLTPAEQAVLKQLVAGRTPGEIARAEAVSISTVRTHVARLHEKYGVSRTIDVVRLAIVEAQERSRQDGPPAAGPAPGEADDLG